MLHLFRTSFNLELQNLLRKIIIIPIDHSFDWQEVTELYATLKRLVLGREFIYDGDGCAVSTAKENF